MPNWWFKSIIICDCKYQKDGMDYTGNFDDILERLYRKLLCKSVGSYVISNRHRLVKPILTDVEDHCHRVHNWNTGAKGHYNEEE